MATTKKGSSRHAHPGRKVIRSVTESGPDDGRRGVAGVVASLVTRPNGTVRIVFDDVRRGKDGNWTPSGLFTSRDFPDSILGDLDMDADEFEQTGVALISRLVALGRTESRGG